LSNPTVNGPPHRPILVVLTSHWISMVGVALVTLSGFSWLFLLPANIRGQVSNPYIGLLVFIAVPAVFILGLILIPIGIALGKRRLSQHFETTEQRRSAWRRAGLFFAIMTAVNIVIGSQASYRAVEQMETVQFCGQSCHVMKPEFTAHQRPAHQAVSCVGCHVVPGAAGWVASKMAGTRQLAAVLTNSFPRPIESAMESNRLVPSADTCEQCHARGKSIGPKIRVISKFKDDQTNTRTETVLLMMVGGGDAGGIHGAHLGPGVHIRYAAADKKRQTIPWVEYRNTQTGVTRAYLASDAKPDAAAALPQFEMQCVDCHNRAAHSFERPDHALDEAIAGGQIPGTLPFIKKTGLELLKASYTSEQDAAQKIPAGLAAFYQQKYPEIATARSADLQRTGQELAAIFGRNVFPDLKIGWGTYPNNLGHMDDPGCFRCHDDSHATADKKTITQDCNTCHQPLAVEEASPEILKSLGLLKSQ
jgi:hypothetical protein